MTIRGSTRRNMTTVVGIAWKTENEFTSSKTRGAANKSVAIEKRQAEEALE